MSTALSFYIQLLDRFFVDDLWQIYLVLLVRVMPKAVVLKITGQV